MANALYPVGKERFLGKAIDMDTDAIKAILVDASDYTYSAAHDDLADVAGAGIVATSAALGSPTIALGVFDSGDFAFTAVGPADQSEDIILYDDTHASDALIAFYDTGMTGMPVTPNGGDINVTVHASGWFAL
jgi:hypothetical protein